MIEMIRDDKKIYFLIISPLKKHPMGHMSDAWHIFKVRNDTFMIKGPLKAPLLKKTAFGPI